MPARERQGGARALPEGQVGPGRGLEEAARAGLRGLTGLAEAWLEQLGAALAPGSAPDAPPTLRVSYLGLLRAADLALAGRPGVLARNWAALEPSLPLAPEEGALVSQARARLTEGGERSERIARLIEEPFSLSELQQVYEAALGRPLDRRNFRRGIRAAGHLLKVSEPVRRRGLSGARAPTLYRTQAQDPG